jgi:hypothetical protein
LHQTGTRVVRYEQAVYGSFPFWDKGYAVLAHSSGVRPAWLAEFQNACRRFGEPPRGLPIARAIFSLRLPHGPWLIVGVGPQGTDDRGRPGALAFHGLLLTAREFRKIGFDPFVMADALRDDWEATSTSLPTGRCPVAWRAPANEFDSDEAQRITAALKAGRRCAIESAEPIDALARHVWSRLPVRMRRSRSVATWAFSNGNRFGLAAFPRLAGVTLDASYRTDEVARPRQRTRMRPPGKRLGWSIGFVALGMILCASLAFALLSLRRGRSTVPIARSGLSTSSARRDEAAPARRDYDDREVDAVERRRVVEALIDFAERFGIAGESGFDPATDPADVLVAISERLRYRGALLSREEIERLRREPGSDQALTWHDQIRRFVPDRPLPGDFSHGPLRWQLDTLAWSFHVRPDRRLSAAEVPHALADALASRAPVRPSPFAARYGALGDYGRFLGRLPQR